MSHVASTSSSVTPRRWIPTTTHSASLTKAKPVSVPPRHTKHESMNVSSRLPTSTRSSSRLAPSTAASRRWGRRPHPEWAEQGHEPVGGRCLHVPSHRVQAPRAPEGWSPLRISRIRSSRGLPQQSAWCKGPRVAIADIDRGATNTPHFRQRRPYLSRPSDPALIRRGLLLWSGVLGCRRCRVDRRV